MCVCLPQAMVATEQQFFGHLLPVVLLCPDLSLRSREGWVGSEDANGLAQLSL